MAWVVRLVAILFGIVIIANPTNLYPIPRVILMMLGFLVAISLERIIDDHRINKGYIKPWEL